VKPLRAILSIGFLALCAGRCDPPFGDPEGHTILYLLALPENVSYTFPPEATVRDAMDDVAAYFLEIVSGGGATPFQVNLDVAFADIGDALEMAVYDGVGNVARRTVY
jgi:hypothetical protein